jgi:ATP-dependent Lon protease
MMVMLIPIYDQLLLPGMTYPLQVKNITLERLQHLKDHNESLIAITLKEKTSAPYHNDDFYKVGVMMHINEISAKANGFQVMVEAHSFAEVTHVTTYSEGLTGDVKIIPEDVNIDRLAQEEMLTFIKDIGKEMGKGFKNIEEVLKIVDDFKELNPMMGFIAQGMPISAKEKYKLIETVGLKERTLLFIDYLHRFKETLQIQMEMTERFTEKANKNYREQALREQLRIIQNELNGGSDSGTPDKDDYRTRAEAADLPEEIAKVVFEEIGKFEDQNPSSSDYNVIRNYIDFILALPWHVDELEDISINEAKRVLDEQHYGLEKVKERILQHLAVMQLRKDKKGSILLLVGPPGTGKTSLGKSIATALNRKYVRISLGGIRDEAQIRGHRRTYVGALPGRILKAMKDAGTMNPVMVLDEVDKLMGGYNGDPASALLEVLDPEQNNTFTDHYLDLPYDLSNVLFITTANDMSSIPGPLLDRMEVIPISSYTASEKFHIGKNHLIAKSLEEHGLTSEDMVIEDATISKIISDYTMEAGVRGLKKKLDTLSRVIAQKVVSGETQRPFVIAEDALPDMLGRQVSRHTKAKDVNPPGVVTGLAWTPVGGEILFIEATDIPGKGGITLTGKLGDVMQESAKIALSLLKSRLPVNAVSFKDKDLHIHVPSGAVPKDGPSAGITLFTALASLLTGIPVDGHIAMTGEISLRGDVMPIGGLKEKLIAANRAGITKALIPIDNVIDLKDVPDEVKDAMTIIPVETIEDVMSETIGITLPRISTVSWLSQNEQGGYYLPK